MYNFIIVLIFFLIVIPSGMVNWKNISYFHIKHIRRDSLIKLGSLSAGNLNSQSLLSTRSRWIPLFENNSYSLFISFYISTLNDHKICYKIFWPFNIYMLSTHLAVHISWEKSEREVFFFSSRMHIWIKTLVKVMKRNSLTIHHCNFQ